MIFFAITGASRGIGAALARAIHTRFKEQAQALLIGRNRERLAGTAAPFGHRASILPVDMADTETFARLLRQQLDKLSPNSFQRMILINNAGVLHPVGPAGTNDPGPLIRNISVNLTAAMVATEQFLAWAGRDSTEKLVLNISSGAGRFPIVCWGAYCAAKAGLDMYSRVLAEEHRPDLRIISVAPGIIETDMQRSIREIPDDRFPLRADFIRYRDTGKLKQPDDVAGELLAIIEQPEPFDILADL